MQCSGRLEGLPRAGEGRGGKEGEEGAGREERGREARATAPRRLRSGPLLGGDSSVALGPPSLESPSHQPCESHIHSCF